METTAFAVVIVMGVVFLWMSYNNYRISLGKPKIHAHRYRQRYDNIEIEECSAKNCKRARYRI